MPSEVSMRSRWIVALVLFLVGAIWIGQGLGLIRSGGFMVGDPFWAIIGAGLLVAGFAVGWAAVRSRTRA
jgi:hypothetical protein